MITPSALVQKLWNYCNILRDDGLSYGDYVEQLTYLLFLKMADEQSRAPLNKPSAVPKGYDWPSLLAKDGDDIETHYRHVLDTLVVAVHSPAERDFLLFERLQLRLDPGKSLIQSRGCIERWRRRPAPRGHDSLGTLPFERCQLGPRPHDVGVLVSELPP